MKNVTVSQSYGKGYVSIQTEHEVADPVNNAASMVGLDTGVTKLATLSDGTIYQPVTSFKASQRKLATLQCQLSRKVKFSTNWQKQKRKIQRLHAHIANICSDCLHNVTTEISKNHAMIVIGDLKESNLSKSAKGTPEQYGRNVKAKSGLNRSILDQGWYEMRRQLEYKQRWRGGSVMLYLQRILAKGAFVAVTSRKKIANHKVNSSVLSATTQRTPISTVLVIF